MIKFIIVAFSLLFAFLIYASIIEANNWATYKKENNCIKFSEISATVAPTITTSGNVGITTIPGKTGWRCDNGKEFWR